MTAVLPLTIGWSETDGEIRNVRPCEVSWCRESGEPGEAAWFAWFAHVGEPCVGEPKGYVCDPCMLRITDRGAVCADCRCPVKVVTRVRL